MKLHPILGTILLPTVIIACLGGAALAEKKETRVATGLSPKQFVKNCENMGGQIDDSSQGDSGASCTLPSGVHADCSFGPKDAYCEVTTPRSAPPAATITGLLGNLTTVKK